MPPKRCQGKGKSMAMKKKKQLEKRLIQISLKLDGFVYKNRPISVFEAEKYIQEISSYQKDCAGDPRALQVIEKLTRCMAKIIAEHKGSFEIHPYTNVTLNDHNYCQSPVYSLPDEDRSQIVENIREASRNLREIETIDLCDDNDDEINNGVSKMSIDDNNVVQNTQSDVSQSVLVNVDFNTLYDGNVSTNKINTTDEIFRMKIEVNKTKNEEGAKKEKPVRKPRQYSNKKNCCTDFVKPADNQKKRKGKANCKENHAELAQNTEANDNKIKVKRRTRKNTTNKENMAQNPVLKIYNKHTENDLSWIENVRYVREVSNEEYYTNLKVGGDFWENIEVPGIDDNDFSYT